MRKIKHDRIIAIEKEKSYNMNISFRAVMYLINECHTNDFAYSLSSQNIIELKADIERACILLNINKYKKITLAQAKKISEYLNK